MATGDWLGETSMESRPASALNPCFVLAWKVKVVGRCPTPRKPLKRFERNFYARQLSLSLKSKVLEKVCANLKNWSETQFRG